MYGLPQKYVLVNNEEIGVLSYRNNDEQKAISFFEKEVSKFIGESYKVCKEDDSKGREFICGITNKK